MVLLLPRLPAEIVGGTGQDVLDGKAKIMDSSSLDVTELYLKGAYRTLDIAQQIQATCVVLKENSPSCGSQKKFITVLFKARRSQVLGLPRHCYSAMVLK